MFTGCGWQWAGQVTVNTQSALKEKAVCSVHAAPEAKLGL